MGHCLTGRFTRKTVALPFSSVYAFVLIVAVVVLYYSGASLMLDVTDFKSLTS